LLRPDEQRKRKQRRKMRFLEAVPKRIPEVAGINVPLLHAEVGVDLKLALGGRCEGLPLNRGVKAVDVARGKTNPVRHDALRHPLLIIGEL